MEFEKITDAEVRVSDGEKTEARMADMELFMAENNLEATKALLDSNPPDARMPGTEGRPGLSVAELIAQAQAEVTRLTARRNRKLKRAGLAATDTSLKDARRTWLDNERIGALEQEYLAHKRKHDERVAALEVTGADALKDSEREEKERQVAEHVAAMATIERLHQSAVEKRNSLKTPK